jgi:hypothetical protein
MALALFVPVSGCAQQQSVPTTGANLTPYHAPYQRVIRPAMPGATLTNEDRQELNGVKEEVSKLRETITARTIRGERNGEQN